jgi:hypothetical protein
LTTALHYIHARFADCRLAHDPGAAPAGKPLDAALHDRNSCRWVSATVIQVTFMIRRPDEIVSSRGFVDEIR